MDVIYNPQDGNIPGAIDLLSETQRLGGGRDSPQTVENRPYQPFPVNTGDPALFDETGSNAQLIPGMLPKGLAPGGGAGMGPGGLVTFNQAQFSAILKAAYRQGDMMQIPFSVGIVSQLLIPRQENRIYLFIINTSTVNRLFLGFGFAPTPLTGIPLEVNLGAYEPAVVPRNDIYILGAAAATTGICVYSTG